MAEQPSSIIDYLAAEDDLRGAGTRLESHHLAAGRTAWHWYPQRTGSPRLLAAGVHLLLVDVAVTLFNTGQDWLELTLDVAWQRQAQLTVSAAVEVACWCPQDHNMHPVRASRWHVADGHELVEGFGAGTALLASVLDSGPFDPGAWRVRAGLPGPSPIARHAGCARAGLPAGDPLPSLRDTVSIDERARWGAGRERSRPATSSAPALIALGRPPEGVSGRSRSGVDRLGGLGMVADHACSIEGQEGRVRR